MVIRGACEVTGARTAM
ncbi:hypothetical protein A2U01_0110468, partial [Trifolium medium]|nr:hypothetical protein [Trifolium medium]